MAAGSERPEYERRIAEAESFREIIEEISSWLELRPLLTEIVRHACELLGADDGAIGLHDEARDLMRIEAVWRMPEEEIGMELPRGTGLAGTVLASGAAVRVARYDELPNITRTERSGNAVLGVPIHGRGRLLGFFGVGALPPRAFTAEDEMLLERFARHAAIAIGNAMQFEREQARARRMELIARVSRLVARELDERQLVATAAGIIHDRLGYPNVGIGLIEHGAPDKVAFRAHAGLFERYFAGEYVQSVQTGIVGAAVRERKAQLVNDVSKDPRYHAPPQPLTPTTELAVPIVLGDEVLGVIDIECDQTFVEDDVASLGIIADTLAVALKNARLFGEARQAAVMRERQRLARDLHDSVTQVISSISLIAQSLPDVVGKDAREAGRRAGRIHQLSELAFAEMRALLRELKPAEGPDTPAGEGVRSRGLQDVGRHGLRVALDRLGVALAPETPRVLIEVADTPARSPAHEELLYRICQEALSNAVRHSGARQVRIRVQGDEAGVHCEISDDGRGFDTRRQTQREDGGLGLGSMRERAEAAGGQCTVHSEPGHGTRIVVRLP